MNPEGYWAQFLYALPDALPWVLGGLGALALLSYGPVGRALTQRLQRGAENAERLEGILEELTLLRAEFAEVIERLDERPRRVLGRAMPTDRPADQRMPDPEGAVTTSASA